MDNKQINEPKWFLPFAHVFLMATAFADIKGGTGGPFGRHHLNKSITTRSSLLVQYHVNTGRQNILTALAKKGHDHI